MKDFTGKGKSQQRVRVCKVSGRPPGCECKRFNAGVGARDGREAGHSMRVMSTSRRRDGTFPSSYRLLLDQMSPQNGDVFLGSVIVSWLLQVTSVVSILNGDHSISDWSRTLCSRRSRNSARLPQLGDACPNLGKPAPNWGTSAPIWGARLKLGGGCPKF